MSALDALELTPAVRDGLPEWGKMLAYLEASPSAARVLREAERDQRLVVQPRCGVGGHDAMKRLLCELEPAGPQILSITIDSHTRLKQYRTAERLLELEPDALNGYPLVAHGWERGRELTETVSVPVEIRHGSPDARDLFAVAVAAGATSFEGGGIAYNLPYSKDVPLADSLRAWQQVDAACGALAESGVTIDREFFGTLTAVLVPPAISLAISLLEAVAAVREGVTCLSLAYPQSGEAHQDVAALRSIRTLARRYLPPDVDVFPVLHQFMGVFPRTPEYANALILCGGLVARLGGATKVINKTRDEAFGIPDAAANAAGIRTTLIGASPLFDFVALDEARIAEEAAAIQREVAELIEPVLDAPDLLGAVERAFANGRLDVPFSASVHARGEVLPCRDRRGSIRYADAGALPFSDATLRRNAEHLRVDDAGPSRTLVDDLTADIEYFVRQERQLVPTEGER